MSSTNVAKNRYRSISLNLTLEQNILILTITTQQTLLFIVSPSFLSIAALPYTFSRRFKTLFITRRFNWALLHLLRFKRRKIHARMSFLLFLLLLHITQDLFLPKFFSKNSQLKTLLHICLRLQAGIGFVTSGQIYPTIIETPEYIDS